MRDAEARIAAATTALADERRERAVAEDALRAKIRTLDATQERLLSEIDAQTTELDRVDDALETAMEETRAVEEER